MPNLMEVHDRPHTVATVQRGLPFMTSQKREGGSKNHKNVWTSFMEAPSRYLNLTWQTHKSFDGEG